MAQITGTSGVETLNGTAQDDTFRLEGGTDTVNGNGGTDTVSFADAPIAVNVNLANGSASGWGSATLNGVTQIFGSFHGGTLTGGANTTYISAPGGDTTIVAGPNSTVITAGDGNDTITGGAGNDYIAPGGGNNHVDGGGGYNQVSYSNITGYVTVDLYAGAWHPGGYDTLANIVNIQGGDYGNTLRGNSQDNIIIGGAGNDVIEGREGSDTLTGGGGADTFIIDPNYGRPKITDFSHTQGDQIDLSALGSFHSLSDVMAASTQVGADTTISIGNGGSLTLQGVQVSSLAASDFGLSSPSAPQTFHASAAGQSFTGSSGTDTVSFANSPSGLTLDVKNPSNSTGWAAGDTFSSIEHFQLTNHDDIFVGSSTGSWADLAAGNDYFYGGPGNDTVYGGVGVKVMVMGGGNDTVYGGSGTNYIYGGGGNDVIHDGSGVNVFIEGSAGSNTIYGGGTVDYLYGGNGTDTIYGGAGEEILVMGSGNNTFHGGSGTAYYYGGSGNDAYYGGSGIDVIVAGSGHDILNGGGGTNYMFLQASAADTVQMNAQVAGVDVVNGFNTANHVIDLQNTGWTSLADVLAHSYDYTSSGGFMIIAPNDAAAIWLIGVQPGQLTAADFHFM